MLFRRKPPAPPGLTLEGALGPNDRLDHAPAMAVTDPRAVCVAGGALLVSSGSDVLRYADWGAAPRLVQRLPAPVTALAASPGGRLAVAAGDRLFVLEDDRAKEWPLQGVTGISDLMFLEEDELALLDTGHAPDQPILALAPWDAVARGQLVAVRATGQRQIASGLHFPTGIALSPEGLVITEMERARIVDLSGKARQSGYPAYLGRLRKTAQGYALACLSRRDPLIEFLKTEPEFVRLMTSTIDPPHWIAPRDRPDFSHDLPITLGATRLHGTVKPWAPSFSYGLVIELDNALMPTGSAHSRANGRRHAICDVCDWKGDLIALSRASGEVLNLGAA